MILSEGSFPLSELHRIIFYSDELFILIAIRNLKSSSSIFFIFELFQLNLFRLF